MRMKGSFTWSAISRPELSPRARRNFKTSDSTIVSVSPARAERFRLDGEEIVYPAGFRVRLPLRLGRGGFLVPGRAADLRGQRLDPPDDAVEVLLLRAPRRWRRPGRSPRWPVPRAVPRGLPQSVSHVEGWLSGMRNRSPGRPCP